MIVGILHLKFFIRGARSLKEKRSVVKSFINRVRAKHNVSVAEVANQDDMKIGAVAVAIVGNDTAFLQKVLEDIRQKAIGTVGAELVSDFIDFSYGDIDEDEAFDWETDEYV